MTLTLDDVRNKRFRMARKTGYEVLEVDEFVDEVEESIAQMVEENHNLRRQVEALRHGTSADRGPVEPAQTALASQAAVSDVAQLPEGVTTMVVTTGKEASSAVVRLVELSTAQAEQLVAEATDEAAQIREEASREAQEVSTDARTRAERLESEARLNAERVQAEAKSRADALDRDVSTRREELFAELERERDELSGAVGDLRRFETSFRGNLTAELRRHIDQLEAGHAEPAEVPDLAAGAGASGAWASGAGSTELGSAEPGSQDGGDSASDDQPSPIAGPPSDTPRLDALLGDQH